MLSDSSELEKYITEHTENEPEVLKELFRQTHVHIYHPRMLSGHIQGRVLKMLSAMIKPMNVLEIGTYTGYSAICLAEGLAPGGKVYSIEINDELEEFIRKYVIKSGFENRIELIFGSAIDEIPKIDMLFDLVFIDGDKKQYVDYFNLVIDKVKTGGYIIADNVLWSGKVVEDNQTDEQTLGILKFNDYVQKSLRVENVLFPIRDGMMVMKKIK